MKKRVHGFERIAADQAEDQEADREREQRGDQRHGKLHRARGRGACFESIRKDHGSVCLGLVISGSGF
jgi:hypothetical protein